MNYWISMGVRIAGWVCVWHAVSLAAASGDSTLISWPGLFVLIGGVAIGIGNEMGAQE